MAKYQRVDVVPNAQMRNHAQRFSQGLSTSYSPWTTNFEEMAKKTVLKKALKYAPLKTDFVRQLTTDETIKETMSPDMTEVDPIIPDEGEVV